MSAAARRRQRGEDESLDVELADLPPAARWREWMLRVEAAIFASARPVPRETLVRLVSENCRFDDLIADLMHELRGRPYDLTLLAGGYALRTKTRFAPAIRAAHPGLGRDDVAELTRTGDLCAHRDRLSAAGHQGGDIETGGARDQPRCHRRLEATRAYRRRDPRPQPGAPFAYVTTRKFLEAFGFASLRDLPDIDRLEAEDLSRIGKGDDDLDGVLNLSDAGFGESLINN